MQRADGVTYLSLRTVLVSLVFWAFLSLTLNSDALPGWARSVPFPHFAKLELIRVADWIDETAMSLGFSMPKAYVRSIIGSRGDSID